MSIELNISRAGSSDKNFVSKSFIGNLCNHYQLVN